MKSGLFWYSETYPSLCIDTWGDNLQRCFRYSRPLGGQDLLSKVQRGFQFAMAGEGEEEDITPSSLSSFQTLTPANLRHPLDMDIGELSSCSNFSPISSNDEENIERPNSDGNEKEIVASDQALTGQLLVSNDIGANNFEDMIYVGKVFESDTDAYEQYLLYAMRVGFRVRKNKQYLRDDGSVRSRYFVCFREGERRKDKRCQYVRKESKERRAREETRTGCKARMAVKNVQSKWVVSEIIRGHNHPLTSPADAAFILPDDKDRKIRELSEEIQQEKRLRTACEKRINQVLKDVEEHTQNLSSKIEVVVKNVKILESEELDGLDEKYN